MNRTSLNLKLAACALAAATFGSAFAGPAPSWNLSRDVYLAASLGHNGNPQGANPDNTVWSFLSVPLSQVHTGPYSLLSNFQAPCSGWSGAGTGWCWRNSAGSLEPAVWTNDQSQIYSTPYIEAGMPHLHPSPTEAVVVRWTSPVAGKIRMLGKFADVDSVCGNGVKWWIDQNTTTIAQSLLSNTSPGEGKVFDKSLTVAIGDEIKFIVGPGAGGNHVCDTTDLDVLITQQQ